MTLDLQELAAAALAAACGVFLAVHWCRKARRLFSGDGGKRSCGSGCGSGCASSARAGAPGRAPVELVTILQRKRS